MKAKFQERIKIKFPRENEDMKASTMRTMTWKIEDGGHPVECKKEKNQRPR